MRAGLKADVVYSFFDPKISVLKGMITSITPDHVGMFREAYGGVLKMVFRLTDGDRSAIHNILQFYDSGLRFFVLPDYLLGPLMEDYASILGIRVRNQIPFYATKEESDVIEISRALCLSQEVTKEGLKGKGKFPDFHLSFLEAKAKEHVVLGNWKAVCALLAVSIYGIILFPNQKNFMDINAIRVFAQKNPIPTLIGDVYYSVHNQNEKRHGGLVRCCAQLLYKWFMGYCLPGVPLFFLTILSSGGINYNPMLLKRQMGFAMEVPPLEREIQESFYFPIEGNQSSLRQVSDAWRNIQRKGKIPFGKANNRSFPPFDDWLRERVELTRLPFPVGDLWYSLIEESRSSVSMEEFLEMKRARDQLQAEKTELEMSIARIQLVNQEVKREAEDQARRHAQEVKRFEIDTAYYCKISQALESYTKEHDITKEKLVRAVKVIEDEKKR
ncbi:hypothetical protein KIW84_074772 [Lathyrus oleraceus]|uniref:DUF7745 domain-containing protein n=1 Tax=Pisum sativum TaxID=3888 RepID=A0A9D4VUS9_PEA|nr:hypothetical protein KIW84_074772 [Pisum sativum]